MRPSRAIIVVPLLSLAACATLQQVLALRNVDFAVDRVSDVRPAGVDLGRVTTDEQIGCAAACRLEHAVSQRVLPLAVRLLLRAENPADNTVDARQVRMDWTLFLQDRETLSGVFADETLLRPGVPTDVPITVELNLVDFFEGSARDLVQLALALSGQGGAPTEVTLRATPTVDTSLGPIRYPRPITIVHAEVGRPDPEA
jgi:hypothetical protein